MVRFVEASEAIQFESEKRDRVYGWWGASAGPAGVCLSGQSSTGPGAALPSPYLREGLSLNALKRIAGALSDNEAVRRMQQAKNKLFERLRLTA
jgi:hypothetical protein